MKLLLKFNLVFLLIFAAGLAATGRVSWSLLERNARTEIAENARMLMDAARMRQRARIERQTSSRDARTTTGGQA